MDEVQPSHDKMGKHMKYFKETFKYRRSAIKCMALTTITNIIEEFPRFKDVSDLVSSMNDSQKLRKEPIVDTCIFIIQKPYLLFTITSHSRSTLSLKCCIQMNAITSLQNGGHILKNELLCWESKNTLLFNKLSTVLRTVSYFSRISTPFSHKLMLYLCVCVGDLCALYVLAYMLHKSSDRKKGKTGIAGSTEGATAYLLQNTPVRQICLLLFDMKLALLT